MQTFFGNLSHCSSKVVPTPAPSDDAPHLELTIIKVSALPNMGADMPKRAGVYNKMEPFVRIRLKEIDTGKVFIHIYYDV